jgi:RNA recognition motif-containing protein
VTYVKIPPGKNCGFVQFLHRAHAEQAITRMNGHTIGTSRVRLSWGRPQHVPPTATSNFQ